MANSFYIIVAIIIIVSGIGSIVKSGADNKRTQYRQSPPPSSQGDKGGFANKEKPPINKRSYGENLTAHSHPAQKGNTRVENVYTESSMGENLSEGCEEHYYERFVDMTDNIQSSSALIMSLPK